MTRIILKRRNDLFCWGSAGGQIFWLFVIVTGNPNPLSGLYLRGKQPRLKKSPINRNGNEVINMREEYDFSTAKKNPYAKRLKKQITINIDAETVEYFKTMSSHSGIPYQTLINLYLADCAANKRELAISWS